MVTTVRPHAPPPITNQQETLTNQQAMHPAPPEPQPISLEALATNHRILQLLLPEVPQQVTSSGEVPIETPIEALMEPLVEVPQPISLEVPATNHWAPQFPLPEVPQQVKPSGEVPTEAPVKALVEPSLEALPQFPMNPLVSPAFNLATVPITTPQRGRNPLQQLSSNLLPETHRKYKIATPYKNVIDFSSPNINPITFTTSFDSCSSSGQKMVKQQQAEAAQKAANKAELIAKKLKEKKEKRAEDMAKKALERKTKKVEAIAKKAFNKEKKKVEVVAMA